MLHNIVVPSNISDNFIYIIHNNRYALLIDPIDPKASQDILDEYHLELRLIVNTHFHWDHINGNKKIAEQYPFVPFAYPEKSAEYIAKTTGVEGKYLLNKDISIRFAEEDVVVEESTLEAECDDILSILETPGHTPGHISLVTKDKGRLWCGDTIFVAGAGNCNSGDPRLLFHTFHNILSTLPDSCEIFCGHDYALNNVKFCLSLEPESVVAKQMLEEVLAHQSQEGPRQYFNSTLGKERSYNPFFRYNEVALQRMLEQMHPHEWGVAGELVGEGQMLAQAFVTTRLLRNRW